MKISEVIHRLEEIKAELGDREVLGVRVLDAGDLITMPGSIQTIQPWRKNETFALMAFFDRQIVFPEDIPDGL